MIQESRRHSGLAVRRMTVYGERSCVILLLAFSSVACAQQQKPKQSFPPAEGVIAGGTIGGKPVPDWVFSGTQQQARDYIAKKQNRLLESITESEAKAGVLGVICMRLNNQIYDAAVEEAVRDLGISPTSQDMEQISKQFPTIPDKPTLRRMAVNHELAVAIDQQIAAQDPVFKSYQSSEHGRSLNEPVFRYNNSALRWTGPGTPTGWFYLENKRYEWWAAREAIVSVLLNDPTLAARCKAAR